MLNFCILGPPKLDKKARAGCEVFATTNKVVVGGEEEGYTEFTKEQFALFMDVVKSGTFDQYV